MLRILDKKYSDCQPVMPKYNALCVFDIEAAKLAFNYGNVDFVIVLNDNTGKFARCYNLHDVIEFLKI